MDITTTIIAFFIIYSFFGWVLESVYKTIYQKKFVNSGFLYGPFCPMYGIGAIIIYFILNDYKDNVLHVFLIGFVVLSIWEYLVGWALEKMFNTKYWDYSEKKFNLDGRVCLFNSILWGLLGVVFIYIIHPFIFEILETIQPKIMYILTYTLLIYIIIDTIISVIKLRDLSVKLDKIKEISENIKVKLGELKKIANTPINIQNIQQVIEELKEQENALREKLVKQTNRLKKRFPTMKSEKISEFLNHRKR